MALVGRGLRRRAARRSASPSRDRATARRPSPARLLAASAVLVAAVLTAWAVWQPEAADRADRRRAPPRRRRPARRRDRQDQRRGRREPAELRPAAHPGGDRDRGRPRGRRARARSRRRCSSSPASPQTWYRLAAFQLGTLDHPREAAATVQGAIFLDPQVGQPNRQLFLAGEGARARAGRPTASGVARASSVPERRRSELDLEAELVEHAPQRAPRVKRRRCGENGSPGRTSGAARRAWSAPARRPGRARAGSPTGTAGGRARARRSPRRAPGRSAPSANGSGASGSSSTSVALRQPRARPLERHARHVGRGQLGRVQLGGQAAVAAAEVERPLRPARARARTRRGARAAGPARRAPAPRARRRSGWPCPYPRRLHGMDAATRHGRRTPSDSPRIVTDGFASYREFAAAGLGAALLRAAAGADRRRRYREPDVWCHARRGRRASWPGSCSSAPPRSAPLSSPEPGMAFLWQLFVEPALVRVRAGARCSTTRRCARRATAAISSIRLFAAAGQARARRFYEREGWVAAGPPFMQESFGMDVVDYRRSLTTPPACGTRRGSSSA